MLLFVCRSHLAVIHLLVCVYRPNVIHGLILFVFFTSCRVVCLHVSSKRVIHAFICSKIKWFKIAEAIEKLFEAWLTYRVSGRFCFPSVQIGLKSTGRSVNYRVLLLPLTKDHCSSTKHLSDNLLSLLLLLCSDSIKKNLLKFFHSFEAANNGHLYVF